MDNQKVQKAYRSVKLEKIVREEENGVKKLVLRGYPILFNVETKVFDYWYGEITEVILPTALDGVDLSNVVLLRSHDPDKILGRNGLNMRLEVDETGLFFECEMLDTQIARDTYAEVAAGLLDGMSFACYLSDEVNSQTKKRTITHFDELIEITITAFPAYKEASVVASRSKTDESLQTADADKAEEAIQAEAAEREKFFKELEEL